MKMNRHAFRAMWVTFLLGCLCLFAMHNIQKAKTPGVLYVTHDGTAPSKVYTDETDANEAAKKEGFHVLALPFERHK